MSRRVRYSLIYAPEVHAHLKTIELSHLRFLRKTIEEQLSLNADRATRNRKPLERIPGPFQAAWELRCGPGNRLRVFYEVAPSRSEVWILAIGVKHHDRLYFAGKEFKP